MIFTWDFNNLCIIFRQWRVTGTFSLLMSLVAIVVLTAGYECLRSASRRYEQSYEARMSAFSSAGSSMSPFSLPLSSLSLRPSRRRRTRICSRLMVDCRKRLQDKRRATGQDYQRHFLRSASLLQLLHNVRCLERLLKA